MTLLGHTRGICIVSSNYLSLRRCAEICRNRVFKQTTFRKHVQALSKKGSKVVEAFIAFRVAGLLIINSNESASRSEKLLCLKENKKEKSLILSSILTTLVWLMRLLCRLVQISILFGPVILFSCMLFMGPKARKMWCHWVLKASETAGATFIKFGQWASTRPDIFSPELCQVLSRLQKDVSPHPVQHTENIMENLFGQNWVSIISIDPNPVGSGCIAQVYKATISLPNLPKNLSEKIRKDLAIDEEENLLPVAIKVLHPNIAQQVKIDLDLINCFAEIFEALVPPLKYISLKDSAREFSENMIKQIDLRIEAENYIEFSKLFKADYEVRFPLPVHPFIWSDVCFLTYEPGIPMNEIMQAKIDSRSFPDSNRNLKDLEDVRNDLNSKNSKIRRRLAELGIHCLFKMIFRHNFVHTDLHPGNLAVQISAVDNQVKHGFDLDALDVMALYVDRESPITLVLYDCGLVTRLQPVKRDSLQQVFAAIVRGNGERVGELFIEQSKISKDTDKSAFISDMARLISNATSKSLTLSNVQVGQLIGNFFGLLRKHRVKLDSSFINIMIAVAVVEGLGRSLSPDLDILKILASYVIIG